MPSSSFKVVLGYCSVLVLCWMVASVAVSCPYTSRCGSFGSGDEPTERELGVVVCRGTAVTLVCPKEGMAEISNPFASADE